LVVVVFNGIHALASLGLFLFINGKERAIQRLAEAGMSAGSYT